MAPESIRGTAPAVLRPDAGRVILRGEVTEGPSSRPIRVLVVDDHADVRFLVRAILGDAGPDLAVAGEAGSAQEAVEAVQALEPDVVVLDARMPGVDGFEAAGMLRERRPDLAIMLCSALVDDDVRARAQAAGIAACVSKDDFEAIPEVARRLGGSRRQA